jgi:hypothetical protein
MVCRLTVGWPHGEAVRQKPACASPATTRRLDGWQFEPIRIGIVSGLVSPTLGFVEAGITVLIRT